MQRVEAGADLHALDEVHGLARSEAHAGLFKRRASVREVVLDYEVLRPFGVDEGGDVGVLVRYDELGAFEAALLELLGDGGVGARRDFVYHRPREGDLRAVDVVDEFLRRGAVLGPLDREGSDGVEELVAVVREVVHADHRDGVRARAEAFEQQRRDYRHAVAEHLVGRSVLKGRLHRGVVVSGEVLDVVALFGDREADHLEFGRAEDFAAAGPLGRIFRVGAQHVAYSRDDLLGKAAVGRHDDAQREVVEGLVNL